jgi:hypothetical protein
MIRLVNIMWYWGYGGELNDIFLIWHHQVVEGLDKF